MLSKAFEKYLSTMVCIAAATWAYHFFTGTHWSYWDRPVTSGDIVFAIIFVVGALYRSADAIVTAITHRQGVDAVARALAI